MVTLNQQSSSTITVMDTNLMSFTIRNVDMENATLVEDNHDGIVHTFIFTWTPTAIIENPVVFMATDDMGASSEYQPRIEFCQCLNGAECTLEGVLNQLANPVDLNCICSNST